MDRARPRMLLVMLIALSATACSTSPPPSPPVASAFPDAAIEADMPAGFASFCRHFPDQCRPTSQRQLVLDDRTWRLLNRVNGSVNRAIWPEDDEAHYGRAEVWTIPTDGYGDCDDYAVTKRRDLIGVGLPGSALRLAVVITPLATRHAVLTVTTDKGALVLDNLVDEIVPWNATGFTWIAVQDTADPNRWVKPAARVHTSL